MVPGYDAAGPAPKSRDPFQIVDEVPRHMALVVESLEFVLSRPGRAEHAASILMMSRPIQSTSASLSPSTGLPARSSGGSLVSRPPPAEDVVPHAPDLAAHMAEVGRCRGRIGPEVPLRRSGAKELVIRPRYRLTRHFYAS